MSALDYVAVAGSAAAFLILLFSSVHHILHRNRLTDAVARQGIVPSRFTESVAILLTLSEALIGTFGLVAIAAWAGEVKLAASLGVILFASFAVYLSALLARASNASCGCDAFDHPVSRWDVARASVLGAVLVPQIFVGSSLANIEPTAAVVASLTAGVLALSIWMLPGAMSNPQEPGIA